MEKTPIVFFYPDQKLGGGPFYLMRLASTLAANKQYEVFYIDYPDGYSHFTNIDKKNITFIDFVDFSGKILFDKPCILFAPIYYLHNLPKVHPNSKVLFFNWHNECLPVLKANMQFSNIQLRKFMEMVCQNNAEVFCDESHYLVNNEISKCKFKPNFVPVIMDKKKCILNNLVSKNSINIAILGRLVKDKIYSINDLIESTNSLTLNKIINIHIIGDGDAKKLISSPNNTNVKIKYCGVLVGDKLNEYLTKNIDILFAMGTSVLEGAACGIPSVVVANDIKPYQLNKFVWLFDIKNGSLGWSPKQIYKCSYKQYNINDILSYLIIDGNKKKLGKKCCDFVRKYFSAEYSTSLLQKYLKATSLTFNDVYKVYKEQCIIVNYSKSYFLRLFKIIPIITIKRVQIKENWLLSLFGIIPIMKIKIRNKFIDFLLFNFIPILRIRKK